MCRVLFFIYPNIRLIIKTCNAIIINNIHMWGNFVKITKDYIKKILFAYITLLLPIVIYVYIYSRYHKIGNGALNQYELYIGISFIISLIYPFTFFKKRLIFRNVKHVYVKSFVLPIFVGFTLNYIISLYRLIPTLYNKVIMDVGSNQVTEDYGTFTIPNLIFKSYFPAFNEEFFFRSSLYLAILFTTIIFYKALKPLVNKYKTTNRNSYFLLKFQSILRLIYKGLSLKGHLYIPIIFLILTSIWFSNVHKPSIIMFGTYFLAGFVDGFFMMKYGLLSGVMCHFGFNFFAQIALNLALSTFNLLK